MAYDFLPVLIKREICTICTTNHRKQRLPLVGRQNLTLSWNILPSLLRNISAVTRPWSKSYSNVRYSYLFSADQISTPILNFSPYSTSLWQETTIPISPQGLRICRRLPSILAVYTLRVAGAHRWFSDEWFNAQRMYHKLASLHIYTVLLTSVLTRQLVALCRPLKAVGNLQLCRFYHVYTAIQDLKSPDISHPLI